jgi:hypothetical protein
MRMKMKGWLTVPSLCTDGEAKEKRIKEFGKLRKRENDSQAQVTHACNPSYVGG